MRTEASRLFFFSAFASFASLAAAGSPAIDFENSATMSYIANGDYGYNWDNVFTLDVTNYGVLSGYQVARHSGDMVALGANAEPCSFSTTDGGDRILGFSGYFASAWENSNVLTVEALRNGAVVNTQTFTLDKNRQDFLTVNFGTNADQVRFSTPESINTQNHFGFDDLTVQTSPVPEPASLITLGLGGLALLRRRKK